MSLIPENPCPLTRSPPLPLNTLECSSERRLLSRTRTALKRTRSSPIMARWDEEVVAPFFSFFTDFLLRLFGPLSSPVVVQEEILDFFDLGIAPVIQYGRTWAIN